MGGFLRNLRSKLGRVHQNPARPAVGVSVEVLQGNLCQGATDVIVNLNSKDMNMDSAGALSKAVKKRLVKLFKTSAINWDIKQVDQW